MSKQMPIDVLNENAKKNDLSLDSRDFAQYMDEHDPLKSFRDKFHIPKAAPHTPEVSEALYLCGNSLGCMTKQTQTMFNEELAKWQTHGVEGHFEGERPWAEFDDFVRPATALLVGAKEEEVCVLNTLTVNLHFLLVSFYRPKGKRTKILYESDAFCSDHHALKSQIRLHGLDPSEHLIGMKPREGEYTLRTEDIVAKIEELGEEIAVVMFGGIQYYTGQYFQFKPIADAGHLKGCIVGFDCAHAFGNVDLKLHDDGVDFACWCTYKYGNSGPGGPGGIFVHERHHKKSCDELPRLAGWWGQDVKARFSMSDTHSPSESAQGWACSNVPIFSNIALLASLNVFAEAGGMTQLRAKSKLLTGYLEHLVQTNFPDVKILTPSDPDQRGCQLSLLFNIDVTNVNKELANRGVICDVRKPSVIRVSPTPLYNRFVDVHDFIGKLKQALDCAEAVVKPQTDETTEPAAKKAKK